HQRLQRVRDDGQLDAGHVGDGGAPAGGGVDHGARRDVAAVGGDAGDAAVVAADGGDLGGRVDLHAEAVGAAGVAPDDGVVADDAAGRVVEAGEGRLVHPLAGVEAGDQLGDLVAADEPAVDAEEAVGLGALAQGGDAAVGVGEGEVALLRE